ncbi:MAG: BspA family leucine-rich repeat surface protein, partial [Prevotella sp.]|nr:BspA family leucine-rich repeat surface protein [Prevotella sp.]
LENNLHPATQVVFDPSFADARPISTAYWFLGMRNLQSFSGLSYLNTSSVTDMECMFSGCSGLTSLDLSGFNTANVAYMENMFLRCSGLTSIDLSSFNTANVGDMSDMFEDCTALTSLDLSSFNTARASFIPYMFNRCSNLTTIYAGSGWNLPADAYSEGMFQDCTSLVGSMGTSYDPNHKDGEYAHIDGGPSDPGYFSEKGGAFLRGDVNGDQTVDIDDVTALISYVLNGDSSSINMEAADCYPDGRIDIDDVTALISFVLNGSWN